MPLDETKNGQIEVANKGGGVAKRGKAKRVDAPPEPTELPLTSEGQSLVRAAFNDLTLHQEFVQEIGSEVARRKVEIARSLPALIDAAVANELAASPLDLEFGARRVNALWQSEQGRELQRMLGVEVEFDAAD